MVTKVFHVLFLLLVQRWIDLCWSIPIKCRQFRCWRRHSCVSQTHAASDASTASRAPAPRAMLTATKVPVAVDKKDQTHLFPGISRNTWQPHQKDTSTAAVAVCGAEEIVENVSNWPRQVRETVVFFSTHSVLMLSFLSVSNPLF